MADNGGSLDRAAGGTLPASGPAPAPILDALPDGVALVDVGGDADAGGDVTVVRWSNERFATWCGPRNPEGHGFFAALGHPDVVGPDQRPFETAVATGQSVARGCTAICAPPLSPMAISR